MTKHSASQIEPIESIASNLTAEGRWPLPRLDGAIPSLILPWDPARDGGLVEIGYRDRVTAPERVPVFAPADGSITYAGRNAQGGTVCLTHPGARATLCSGLETLLVPVTDARGHRRSRVRTGDVLGYLRRSLRLGFRMTQWVDHGWRSIDPAIACQRWALQPWFTDDAPGDARFAIGA